MKDKKIVFYTIYEEEEKTKDLKNIANFDNLQEISDYLQVKKATLKSMITQKNKIKDKYIIIKDYILESEI